MSSVSSEDSITSSSQVRRSSRARRPTEKVREARQLQMEKQRDSESTASEEPVVQRPSRAKGKSFVRPRSRSIRGGKPGSKTVQTIEQLKTARIEKTKNDIVKLSLKECQELLLKVLERVPGILFDVLAVIPPGSPVPNPGPLSDWCSCLNCRPMPTLIERVCCGAQPENCVSRRPEMDIAVLDRTVIAIALAHQQDLLGYGDYNAEDIDANISRAFRFGAYRQFVLWEYGRLGKGIRAVIPSCCVIRIREKYPDPYGQYVGFKLAEARLGAPQPE